MINCEAFRREIPDRECVLRQIHRRLAASRRYDAGLEKEFHPCLFCEEGEQLKKELEEQEMAIREEGVCTKCGQTKKLTRAGVCWGGCKAPGYRATPAEKPKPAAPLTLTLDFTNHPPDFRGIETLGRTGDAAPGNSGVVGVERPDQLEKTGRTEAAR